MSVRDRAWPDGVPCWVELQTSDRASAWEFYGAVLGWEIVDLGEEMGHYSFAMAGGRHAAAISPAGTGTHDSWITYFATSDVAAASGAVTAAGGSVLVPPTEVAEEGRFALAEDPTGASFGLWQAAAMIGAGVHDEPGAMVWHDLMTREPQRAREFYTAVLGWDHHLMPGGAGYSTVPHAEAPGGAVCGIGPLPADAAADVPAHWQVYFHVADVGQALKTGRELGGTVVTTPRDTPYGRMSIAADPRGARFALLQR